MKVFLNTVGLLCALGDSTETVRENLFAGHAPGMRSTDAFSPGRPLTLGTVSATLPTLDDQPLPLRGRNNALLALAFAQIETAYRQLAQGIAPERIAVILGTSTSSISQTEYALPYKAEHGDWPADYHYAHHELGTPATFIAHLSGARGPAYAISTACSSSARALATGARMLRAGMADLVIAGGADSLCHFTVAGFSALESVSAERCNPFSANRHGINIGEGAALFVMSREPGPVALGGWGESSDAHHISAPEPTGRGAHEAVRQALQRAGLDATQLDYINCHGTATPLNDAMESRVFGELCPQVPASSTKALTGHTLGAAGAVEAALCWLTLTDAQHRLPPNLWDGQADSELPALNLVAVGDRATQPVRNVLSTSFAFGGNNAALVLSRHD
ncbi:MAG: beta-ketoacyl-ACP synthase [Moraxellaceae bacterium]|nr:beta-ketoacyl-ACP synthase [Moraxellaceae bacterium]